ncbi:MAG TPA: fumarate reductase subunit C [Aromatoleum sp.]|uniref:fumarate reductase subunit C n=1 Tax=Aromatoleum sp. TaxID=2307007 RepID=UPI002B45B6F0|nr:fumarate reductase subunit C [Aromatoleum sp.]HJV26498.1 fumarate reductase subunit C [Aromatoleum sp.]
MSIPDPRRPYMRPMTGWWRRNPFFIEYMIHEGMALFVAAYAIVLLVGLLRLAQGEAAWNGWLDALRSPLSVAFHVVLLAAIGYHAWTWFRIMPKTMPPVVIGGRRLRPSEITAAGVGAAILASIVLLGVAWGLMR